MKKTKIKKTLGKINARGALIGALVGGLCFPQALAKVMVAAQPYAGGLTEAACDALTDDHGKNAASSEKLRSCCDRVFDQASASSRQVLDFDLNRLVAAAKGRIICVDEFLASPPATAGAKLKYKFRRRNVITGRNSKLNQISALAFGKVGQRLELFTADNAGSKTQILAFNPHFHGNVYPDRELHAKEIPLVASMVVSQSDQTLLILGGDGAIRSLSLKYNDLGIRPEDKSQVDSVLIPQPELADPVAIGVSDLLKRIFVLTVDGKVHVYASGQSGIVSEESSFSAQDLNRPVDLKVIESEKQVIVRVVDSVGASFEAKYDLPVPAQQFK